MGDSLTSHVLSVLATRIPANRNPADEMFLQRLCQAAQSFDPEDHRTVVQEMRAARIPVTDIVDVYVPIVARRMGVAWCEDEMSFAEVTIGASRLQAILREISDVGARGKQSPPDSPAILMAVPGDEYHTLGAMVATAQLRRLGASVRLCVGQRTPVLTDLIETGDFDAIMLSLSQSQKLDRLRRLVLDIRHALPRPAPVVVGGAIMDLAEDVKAQTGADHAVNDAKEALRLCGLKVVPQGSAIPTGRS